MPLDKSKRRIVIYGAGVAGAALAKKLSPKFGITLVDPNDYFEVPMAVPRSLVPPDFAEQAIIPFNKALHDVELVRGTLSEFRAHSGVVMLRDDGQQIVTGDVSVLATGSTFTNSLMRATGGASAGRPRGFLRSVSAAHSRVEKDPDRRRRPHWSGGGRRNQRSL